MSVALGLTIAALALALTHRWRREGAIDLDGVVTVATLVICIVGILATVLGVLGMLTPLALAAAVLLATGAIMPWRRGAPAVRHATLGRHLALVLGLLAGAAALRWPPIDHALAGRDQGSYVLRAESTARTGGFDIIDPIVRDATREPERAGAIDIAGLYPRRGEAWRADVYEAGYRPGWYLADRDRGLVVPQFLHLHPTLSTVALWLVGDAGPGALVVLEGLLSVLALLALARRLLPAGPWAGIAAATFALSPLAIWVHRNTLTEALTGLLTLVAALACARARDRVDNRNLMVAALLLGTTAWVRGNAWITAPVVLATLWLLPPGATRHRATMVFVLVLGASVIVHAATVFPYLHDELVRQLVMWAQPSPIAIVGVFGVALVAWWSADEIVFGPRSRHGPMIAARMRPLLPGLLAIGIAGAIAAWALRAAAADGAPWSRLDALVPGIGVALLVPAAIGIVLALPRWARNTTGAADVWLCAIAALVVTTTWTYAGRNLPKFGLYYYGRYLVPELLPLACLASAYTLARVHGWLADRGSIARVLVLALGAVQLGAIAWPLAVTPATRLQEFAGAGRIVDALADRVPDGAIVIAGGEGWHHGHTFNQVAGALAMRHGRSVVPYHSREAAYATLHELLVTGPAAHGTAPPRVFLLVNEATHALGAPARGMPIAALDDGLAPPFVAASVALFELVTDRLTPTHDALPTAVTRDALRMGLIEVVVDAASSGVQRVALGSELPAGITITGDASGCLDPDRALEIQLASAGTSAIVLVATPDHAQHVESWRVTIDGEPRRARGPGGTPRHRATLGPYALRESPHSISILGTDKAVEGARCPHGELQEIRLLGPERSALNDVAAESFVFAPAGDLGHPVTAVQWVSGRGLSRMRPQLDRASESRANALALVGGAPLRFVPEPNAPGNYDVVVNLTAATLAPDARIHIWADDADLGVIDPPDTRNKSWQSPPLRFETPRPVTQWRLELVDAGADDIAWVRDIGLFSRTP